MMKGGVINPDMCAILICLIPIGNPSVADLKRVQQLGLSTLGKSMNGLFLDPPRIFKME